jgi:hypothetical protein
MGGGETLEPSFGYYMSVDGGINWNRPQCTDAATCQLDCISTGNDCVLGDPDPVGDCTEANPNWDLCYLLPDLPAYTGGESHCVNTGAGQSTFVPFSAHTRRDLLSASPFANIQPSRRIGTPCTSF